MVWRGSAIRRMLVCICLSILCLGLVRCDDDDGPGGGQGATRSAVRVAVSPTPAEGQPTVTLALTKPPEAQEPASQEPASQEPAPQGPEAPDEGDGTGAGGSASAEQTFDPAAANGTLPEDVLEEVAYGGGGGDGMAPECWQYYGEPTVVLPPPRFEPPSVELALDEIYALTCGWKPDEEVQVDVDLPNQVEIEQHSRAAQFGPDYGVEFSYYPSIGDPEGLYVLTFRGESGTLTIQQQVVAPQGPRLLWYRVESGGGWRAGDLYLYNFEPHDRVRLFAYRSGSEESAIGHLAGWQAFQVDGRGQLLLPVEPAEGQDITGYAAIGDVSGEANGFKEYSSGVFFPMLAGSARDVRYVVVETDGAPLDVRASCYPDSEVIGQVAPGTRLEVIGSQLAETSSLWWEIRSAETEGCVEDRWVRPVP